jgi:hypothetical protein
MREAVESCMGEEDWGEISVGSIVGFRFEMLQNQSFGVMFAEVVSTIELSP